MGEFTVVCWRDIPAQLIEGKGRKSLKVKLSDKFEQAIDRCAMKIGAKESEKYLAEWRKVQMSFQENNSEGLHGEARKIEKFYDNKKLSDLIENSGWDRKSNYLNIGRKP